jgi:exodeoxyribonuclease VII small subunit
LAENPSRDEAVGEPSFEEALGQLESIVRQLEEGEIGLNEALEQYEKGVKLLRRCYDLLEHAERRIELLSGVDPQGNPLLTPMDDPSLPPNERVGRRRSPSDSTMPPDRGPA